VIAVVERLIREGPNGHLLKTVAIHQQTRYDRERKTRHGRCQAVLQGQAIMEDWTKEVTYKYKVYWLDQRTGQLQVEIEP
jgi:hypothetical protein